MLLWLGRLSALGFRAAVAPRTAWKLPKALPVVSAGGGAGGAGGAGGDWLAAARAKATAVWLAAAEAFYERIKFRAVCGSC